MIRYPSLAVIPAILAIALTLSNASRAADPEVDPVLQKLGDLVGGRWEAGKNAEGVPFAEYQFEWTPDRKAIAGRGVLGKTTPKPQDVQVRLGWDPVAKRVYYLDSHGTETVYFGHVRLEGEVLVYEFKTLVGQPGDWIIRDRFVDADTRRSEFFRMVDGKPAGAALVIEMKRTGR